MAVTTGKTGKRLTAGLAAFALGTALALPGLASAQQDDHHGHANDTPHPQQQQQQQQPARPAPAPPQAPRAMPGPAAQAERGGNWRGSGSWNGQQRPAPANPAANNGQSRPPQQNFAPGQGQPAFRGQPVNQGQPRQGQAPGQFQGQGRPDGNNPGRNDGAGRGDNPGRGDNAGRGENPGRGAGNQGRNDGGPGRNDNGQWHNDGGRNGGGPGRGNDGQWRGNDGQWRGGPGNGRPQGGGEWSHGWRQDRRYDWRGYREANRDAFHANRYYAPYRDYNYNRLGVGFYLQPLFFGSDYWIADPWEYRLPPAYGPYHWVRYYNDVVLVNTYTGQVADVIYDFFL